MEHRHLLRTRVAAARIARRASTPHHGARRRAHDALGAPRARGGERARQAARGQRGLAQRARRIGAAVRRRRRRGRRRDGGAGEPRARVPICTRRWTAGGSMRRSMREALLGADREVGRSIARRTAASGAATVALCAGTGLLLSSWLIAWVGDCRVYRVEAAAGRARAAADHRRHVSASCAKRRRPAARPTIRRAWSATARSRRRTSVQVALARGEMLVLCSDGVHKHVEPQDLSGVLHGTAPLARRCGRLARACPRARQQRRCDGARRAARARAGRASRGCAVGALAALVAALAVALMVAA